jgi:hypothetical protein
MACLEKEAGGWRLAAHVRWRAGGRSSVFKYIREIKGIISAVDW